MCSNGQLRLRVGRSDGAMGSVYLPIEFTNVGSKQCWLFGYPGVSAWNGQQVGRPADRDTSVKSKTVSLKPGAHVAATLRIIAAGNLPAATCKPKTVATLRVFPPGSYSAQFVTYRFTACSGSAVFMYVRPVA